MFIASAAGLPGLWLGMEGVSLTPRWMSLQPALPPKLLVSVLFTRSVLGGPPVQAIFFPLISLSFFIANTKLFLILHC